MSRDVIRLNGVIKENLPCNSFKVELENHQTIKAVVAGKIKRFQMLRGDEVVVELSPYDLTLGRIVERK